MSRQLVFVHGRAQQGKNPDDIKREWVESLTRGLEAGGLPPVPAEQIRLPYYGDALDQMTHGTSADEAAEVIVRGEPDVDDASKRFMFEVFEQVQQEYDISESAIAAQAALAVTERGPLNWRWVRAILQRLDTIPQLSAATLALATYDVFQYLTNGVIRRRIDNGVRQAMTSDADCVVVGHSLGSVVAYTLLLREGGPRGWRSPRIRHGGFTVGGQRDQEPGAGNRRSRWKPGHRRASSDGSTPWTRVTPSPCNR